MLGRTSCVPGGAGQPPKCGSDRQPTYQPASIFRLGDVFAFLDSLLYRVPGTNPAEFRVQPFFVWYAPRIPHQPLRAPQPIRDYLFGAAGPIRSAGSSISGSLQRRVCPPSVTAFNENNFGTVHEMFSNVWWMDHGLREIRKFLARQSEPHCIGVDGKSQFDVPQGSCGGTWASTITPNLAGNTVIITMADNGWHLPNSKHTYTENGYRSRLIVFDPRAIPSVPGWDADQQAIPPAQESPALAHATDIHTTVVGYALNSAPGKPALSQAPDGTRCDGKDLRPYLATARRPRAGVVAAARAVRTRDQEEHAARREDRYLLTREGSVGRCTNLAAPRRAATTAIAAAAPPASAVTACRARARVQHAPRSARPVPSVSATSAAWRRRASMTATAPRSSPGRATPASRRRRAGAATIPACAAPRATTARPVPRAAPAAGCASRAG